MILCILHLKVSLVLPASHRFDDGTLGHVRSVEDTGWNRRGQEGDFRGHKIHILPSSHFNPQADLFMPTSFFPCALDSGTVPFSECLPNVVFVLWSLICQLHGSLV